LNVIHTIAPMNYVDSNMTGATSGAGTAYPSGAPESTPGF